MRDVHANIEKGDEKAALAFKMLTRSIKKVLGSYFFLLGNVDSHRVHRRYRRKR